MKQKISPQKVDTETFGDANQNLKTMNNKNQLSYKGTYVNVDKHTMICFMQLLMFYGFQINFEWYLGNTTKIENADTYSICLYAKLFIKLYFHFTFLQNCKIFPTSITCKMQKIPTINPADIFLFKVNNKSTKQICEICLELTKKTPERHQ